MAKATKPTVRRVFTWSEFMATAEKKPPEGASSSRGGNAADWYGASWKDTVKMAHGEGYASAVVEAEAISKAVESTIATEFFQTTFQSTWEVAGAEVDMGRFLAGEPECMIESQPIRIARQGRAIRLIVPFCFSGGTDTAVIMRRGAAVLALVDILSRAQHPLEVWAVLSNNGGDRGGKYNHRASWAALVQPANEPVDMGRIMFALAHPAMLRRLGFAVMEQEDEAFRAEFNVYTHGGYGMVDEAREDDVPPAEGACIILPALQHSERNAWNEAYAVKWVEEQVTRIFGEG